MIGFVYNLAAVGPTWTCLAPLHVFHSSGTGRLARPGWEDVVLHVRELLGREVVAADNAQPLGVIADILFDPHQHQATALVIQGYKPAALTTSGYSAAGSQWVAPLTGRTLTDVPITVDVSSRESLERYSDQFPQYLPFTRLAGQLPILNEAGQQISVVWDLELGARADIEHILYRVRRPSGVYHEVRIYPNQIASIDSRRVIARL